ncbi:MAG: hypothetical protein WBM39_06955 [Parasphingorhabdus sp.]
MSEENDKIHAMDQSRDILPCPHILRDDIAAVAAISLWMAGRGDCTI